MLSRKYAKIGMKTPQNINANQKIVLGPQIFQSVKCLKRSFVV
jgi:hypothetical protein